MPYCPECSASVPEGAAQCPMCGSALVTTPSATDSGGEPPPPLDTDALRAELAASLAPRYEMLKPLGSGGMGAVFLAREPALRRLVAVKVLAPHLAAQPRARARFEREARAAAALSHPNVVRVYAVGETAGSHLPYIIMQYVEGETLGQWLASRQRGGEREVRRIIGEAAAALAAAHARELVHRDIKPSNILIETESGRAFVADFGVSAALSPVDQSTKLTMTGTIVGTPAYMSPEQAAGEPVAPKSDVYSLGLVAYELLTGSLPYSATTAMGWAAAHLRDPVTPMGRRRPDLSPEVSRLIDRCLSKDPGQRPHAQEVARALVPSLESEVSWPPPGLSWLMGRGRMLARISLLTLAGGLATMAALAFTPRILQVHAYWLTRFSSAAPGQGVARGFPGDPGANSQFIWQALLIVGITVFATGVAGLVWAAGQVAWFTLLRRSRGWRWTTLVDVAVDPDGRSGLVLAGAREFASLDQATREGILRLRRMRTAAELGTGMWVTLVAALWVVGVAMGLISNTIVASLFPSSVFWAAMLPAFALLVTSAAAENLEARRTRLISRRRDFTESEADVLAWYQATPGHEAPASPLTLPRRAVLLGSRTGVAVLIVGLTAAVVVWFVAGVGASLVAAIAMARLGPETVELRAAMARVAAEDPIGAARQILAPYVPTGQPLSDSATTRQLRRLLRPTQAEPPVPDYQPSPASLRAAFRTRGGGREITGRAGRRGVRPLALPSEPLPGAGPDEPDRRPGMAFPTTTIEMFRRAGSRQIPADTVSLLQALGRHSRTQLFRRLTHADHWDLLESLDRPLGQGAGPWGIVGPAVNRLAEAALANLLGAVADVARGNLDSARARLGENAAAGLRMLNAPDWDASSLGRSVLEAFAMAPLAELEQLAGNGRQAVQLREVSRRLLSLSSLTTRGMSGLAADPAYLNEVTRALRLEQLPLGWRVALMDQVVMGACTNPREILLGASPTRRAGLLTAAAAMTGVPHAAELAALAADNRRFDLGQHGITGFVIRAANCLLPA